MSLRRGASWSFSCILCVKSGGVSIKLIYWQLKTALPPPPPHSHTLAVLPPLGAGWGEAGSACRCPFCASPRPPARGTQSQILSSPLEGQQHTPLLMIQVKRQIWLFYGLVWMVEGQRLCSGGAAGRPWAGWVAQPQTALPWSFSNFLRKISENFATEVLPSLGSCRGVSVAPFLGTCVGRALLEKGMSAAGAPSGEHKMEAPPGWVTRPQPLPLGKITCYCQRPSVRRRDRFIPSSTLWDFKFWTYFFPFSRRK